jgi:site-specific recombinase XerD
LASETSALRGFYRFARSHGLVARVPLPTTLPKRPPSETPYIFTRDELRRLLDATARSRTSELDPSTMRVLLLLLYGAALRLGEALGLTIADVDLDMALLTIRDTKFYKTRLVPVGPDLCRVIQQYAEQRRGRPGAPPSDATFLTGRSGRPLRAGTVRRAFARLRQSAGFAGRMALGISRDCMTCGTPSSGIV